MQPVYDGKEMRELDRWAIEEKGIPGLTLMERAAQAVVDQVVARSPQRVAVVCGIGNNGGDGFAVARLLLAADIPADIYLVGDPGLLKEKSDAAVNFERAMEVGCVIMPDLIPASIVAEQYDVVVDALFGTGLSRAIEGEAAEAVQWMNELRSLGKWVIAVDIPSGIHAGTGQVLGYAVQADETVTFSFNKAGLVIYPGREYAGIVHVADIGIGQGNPINWSYNKGIIQCEDVKEWLPVRMKAGHKGSCGKVLIAAGSPGMMGAAIFAAKAAYRAGAGLVRVVIPRSESLAMTVSVPEAVQILYDDPADIAVPLDVDSVLVGPGLGANQVLFEKILQETPTGVPIVVDADGLNMLAKHPEYGNMHMILTPHMGEASRLAGKSIAELYRDLPAAAREIANQYSGTVVLKNASTIVTGKWMVDSVINITGNSGMSTAGSGDVLAGLIAGLCAQRKANTKRYSFNDAYHLAAAAVWLHGRAGDEAAKVKGEYALMASDIIEYLRPDLLIQE
ncbi:MAG: NAD(P)H-hydrate dehydratase [Firmicutes bacterium]|nr:NAD(P)H-hydrate dehydratase [Bacillota bacterium]